MITRTTSMLFGSLCAVACGPAQVDPCRSLADLAEDPPHGAAPRDWETAISQIEDGLQSVDDRYARLQPGIFVGTAHAKDNSTPKPGMANEFDGEVIALLTHGVPGSDGIPRDGWVLRVFDVEERLSVELQQSSDDDSITYASSVFRLASLGGNSAQCADCFPRLSELQASRAAIVGDATFTGTWDTGDERIVTVELDLVPTNGSDLGLLPVWLASFRYAGENPDTTDLDFVDGEIILSGSRFSESYPVPAGAPHDACTREVEYSVAAYISEECSERYGARDLELSPPTLCCRNNCFDCYEQYCLDPDEYDF